MSILKSPIKRKLTTILYADIVGYSRLTHQDELGTHLRVMDFLDYASEAISNGGGTVLRYSGDAILAEFESVIAATDTAIEVQKELSTRNGEKSDSEKVQIRIGLNLGEVMLDRGEIYGEGVNLAARLEAAAQPGGVCISSFVHEQIASKIDFSFVDGGEETFKNIGKPVRIYRWHPDKAAEQTQSASHSGIEGRPSIAVLPFKNLSIDPEQEFFADGITEDIITELSRDKDIFVIARNSTMAYKGQSPDLREVSKDLGVKYVLEGSIRRSGNRIRLSAQLIEGETNHHVWAEKYDRSLEDIFEVQDDLTNVIMNTLLEKIRSTNFNRALRRSPQTMAAYDHYVRGLAYLYQLNKTDNETSLFEAKKSLKLDPNYARGHMLLAMTRLYGLWSGWSAEPEQDLALAHQGSLKAIACDRTDFWGHAILAFAELFRQNHDRAVSAIDRAIELNPNGADSRAMRAAIYNFIGRSEEALEEVTIAIRHNPNHPHWYLIAPGRALFMLGRYDEAVPYLERLVNASEDASTFRALLAATYMALGRDQEAKAQIGKALETFPNLNCTDVRYILPMKKTSEIDHFVGLLKQAGLPD